MELHYCRRLVEVFGIWQYTAFYIPKIINDQDETNVHIRSQKNLKPSPLASLAILTCCRTSVISSLAFIIHLRF